MGYGHLALILKAPLVSTALQNHLNTCENLKNLCFRIEKMFPRYPSDVTHPIKSSNDGGKPPVVKREQLLTLIATVAAMATYVMTSGVMTSRRSRLAQVGDSRTSFDFSSGD